jgi:hypothetical protein
MLCIREIRKGVRKRVDFFRSILFWQSDENKKKYRSTKWSIVYRPQDQADLGIEVLEFKKQMVTQQMVI